MVPRLAVAGAQHKLLTVLKGTDVYEPVGAMASTHSLDHQITPLSRLA